MKNYLIGAVRPSIKIWEPWLGIGDSQNSLAKAQMYDDMYNLSRASAKKYLVGDWEEIKYTAPVLDARMYQIAQWYLIKELWFKEPCNILVMGSDTLFIRPTEIFGKFDGMRMFNYSDPKHIDEIPHNFNDDVRYYSSTMDPKIWELGERKMADWFSHKESSWACGQHIHNHMIWSQGIGVNDMLKPEYAWQAVRANKELSEEWNGCKLDQTYIVHFHGSRGSAERFESMKQLFQYYSVSGAP